MTAYQALFYSKEKYTMVSDAWSHAIHLLSYHCYFPAGYKYKGFSIEMEELFEDFKKYGFVFLDEKEKWQFKRELSIEDGIKIIKS